jgi:DNA-binding Lrp family transcriptional regulator
MHLKPKAKRNLKRILPFGIIWLVLGWVFLLAETAATGNQNMNPDTAITLTLPVFIFASIAVFIAGLLVGLIEVTLLEKRFRHYSLGARIVQKACEKPEGGYTSWSQRRIAKELGMSQSTVQKTLKEHILKPHKVDYWCGKSTDPEFEAKMLNVIGLYLNPDKNAMVLSVDEKTQIQALDRSQPELPLRSGNAKRLTATYKRNGTVSLIAALAVHHGEITAQTIEKNNHENFLKFLKKLYRKYPKKHLHIIADQISLGKDHLQAAHLSIDHAGNYFNYLPYCLQYRIRNRI